MIKLDYLKSINDRLLLKIEVLHLVLFMFWHAPSIELAFDGVFICMVV